MSFLVDEVKETNMSGGIILETELHVTAYGEKIDDPYRGRLYRADCSTKMFLVIQQPMANGVWIDTIGKWPLRVVAERLFKRGRLSDSITLDEAAEWKITKGFKALVKEALTNHI